MNIKIIDKTFDFKNMNTFQKYKTLLWIQGRYILWLIFKEENDPVFMESCTIKSFHVNKIDRLFFLGKFVHLHLTFKK